MANAATTPPAAPGLARAIGRWDLLALVINGIIGAGIFGLPARVHALLGPWGLAAVVACAVIIGLVILCFAEVASRFSQTGGPYVYAEAAFGPFAGFLTGWMLWVARITGFCAICALLLQYLAYLWPGIDQGWPRVAVATLVVGTLTVVHVLGIRRAALFGNIVTVAKLAPLLLFVAVGLFHVDGSRLVAAGAPPGTAQFAQGMLLLTFTLVGWESVVVAAGEIRDPQRTLPSALLAGLACVALLYVLILLVCIGTLPGLASSGRPIIDAGATFLGPRAALLLTLGAVVSMLGVLHVTLLAVSRLAFAMAGGGGLPRALAAIHPRFRTPHVAVLSCGVLALLLTLTGQFTYLVTVSATARLLAFAVTCAALPVLRRKPGIPAARFMLPGGPSIPVIALALIAWLLASSTSSVTRDVVALTVAGALLYAAMRWRRRHARNPRTGANHDE
jgi:amino acid transporter